MAIPAGCQELKGGASGELVVAADFPSPGRVVAGFSELVRGLDTGHTLWETAPPPPDTTARERVDWWLAGIQAGGMKVRAVLGYCVGGVYAAALVDGIAHLQCSAPELIVFDPERPDPALLERHFNEALDMMAALLLPPEVADARRAATAARSEGGGMVEVGTELAALARRLGAAAGARAGLDPARSGELTASFTAFLSYLVTAAELDPLDRWREATALTSASAHAGLNQLAPDLRARTVAREQHFAVPHQDLLRDAGVARAVGELLA
jgi:hypothetical protein